MESLPLNCRIADHVYVRSSVQNDRTFSRLFSANPSLIQHKNSSQPPARLLPPWNLSTGP